MQAMLIGRLLSNIMHGNPGLHGNSEFQTLPPPHPTPPQKFPVHPDYRPTAQSIPLSRHMHQVPRKTCQIYREKIVKWWRTCGHQWGWLGCLMWAHSTSLTVQSWRYSPPASIDRYIEASHGIFLDFPWKMNCRLPKESTKEVKETFSVSVI